MHQALSEEHIALSAAERAQLIQDVTDDTLGYGPIDRFLHDPGITEVMVNGPKMVYIERRGKLEHTDVEFVDEDHLRRTIDKIVSQVGRRIDEASPMVDARLPDGSRVNAVIHPVAIGGPFLTIRRFSKDPYTVDDLINFGTLTPQVAHFLDACVRGQLNAVISGGTGTGKTTLLNVVSSFIPDDDRIVTIEDAKELRLSQTHVCSLEARPPNVEGKGEVKIRELVRNSLRMRPDRVIVGEVRGAEALDMLQAMNTGHDGSLTTVPLEQPARHAVPYRDHDDDGRHRVAHPCDPGADGVGARPDHPPLVCVTALAASPTCAKCSAWRATRSSSRTCTRSTSEWASTTTAGSSVV